MISINLFNETSSKTSTVASILDLNKVLDSLVAYLAVYEMKLTILGSIEDLILG